MTFVSSGLIAVVRTLGTVLNRRDESAHSCLVFLIFSFSLLLMMLAVGLSCMVLITCGMFHLFLRC